MGFFIIMQYVIITKYIIRELTENEDNMKFYDRKTELEKLVKFETMADRDFFSWESPAEDVLVKPC